MCTVSPREVAALSVEREKSGHFASGHPANEQSPSLAVVERAADSHHVVSRSAHELTAASDKPHSTEGQARAASKEHTELRGRARGQCLSPLARSRKVIRDARGQMSEATLRKSNQRRHDRAASALASTAIAT